MKKLLLIVVAGFYLQAAPPDPAHYSFLEVKESKNSYISILYKNGNKDDLWVLKQKRFTSTRAEYLLALDAYGSSVAASIGFPTPKARVVSPKVEFPGKHFQDRAAILSPFFTARPVRLGGPYMGIKVNQLYYSVASEQRGMRPEVLKNMGRHPDLPILCAIDTFLGNTDRCCDNLVRDESADRFIAFDFDVSGHRPLCKAARNQILKLFTNEEYKKLSADQRQGIIAYRNALALLFARNPADKLEQRLEKFVKQALPDEISSWEVQGYLNKNKRFIRRTFEDAHALLVTLNDLISKFEQR